MNDYFIISYLMENPINPHPFIKELEPHLAPHSLVADIGSFTGYNGLFLVEKGHAVANVDLAPEVLRDGLNDALALGSIATRNFFIQGDASQLMFGNETFDAVVSMHMLQQLPSSKVPEALQEMQRVTKAGGYNAIKVYTGTPHEIAARPEYFIFNFGQLRKVYDSVGWEVISYDEKHNIPDSDKDGISSYSKIIARKLSDTEKQKQELLRQAEYYRKSDIEYYNHLMEQITFL